MTEGKKGDASTATQAEDDSRKVCLVSQQGDSFEVSVGIARMSELVKTMIEGKKTHERSRRKENKK